MEQNSLHVSQSEGVLESPELMLGLEDANCSSKDAPSYPN